MIKKLMKAQNMSMYSLSKNSGIPYATIHDICNDRVKLGKCNAETVYKLARTLNVPMETILEPEMEERANFELFKSNVCHRLKEQGDIDFMLDIIQSDIIRTYYDRKWYRESFYLLGMLDYVSRMNNIPQCTAYDDIRCGKLSRVVYPASVLVMCAVAHDDSPKNEALKQAIPEFLRFNIVESEVRNVA